jgi:hypothetical protein
MTGRKGRERYVHESDEDLVSSIVVVEEASEKKREKSARSGESTLRVLTDHKSWGEGEENLEERGGEGGKRQNRMKGRKGRRGTVQETAKGLG